MELTDNLSDQSMRYGTVRLAVPPGFQNIIRLISHEVLREQPKDSIKFIAEFLQDVLTIREDTGYDPVLQGELIQLVQAQYSQLRKDRTALSDQQVKRPVPPDGDETGGEAGGDAAPATKKQATETVSTMVDDVIESVEESANQDAVIPEEETEPCVSPVPETESALDETEEAPLETEAAPPETTEAPLETEAVPQDTITEEDTTDGVQPGTTEEVADSTDEPAEAEQEPSNTEEEPSVAVEEPSEEAT